MRNANSIQTTTLESKLNVLTLAPLESHRVAATGNTVSLHAIYCPAFGPYGTPGRVYTRVTDRNGRELSHTYPEPLDDGTLTFARISHCGY